MGGEVDGDDDYTNLPGNWLKDPLYGKLSGNHNSKTAHEHMRSLIGRRLLKEETIHINWSQLFYTSLSRQPTDAIIKEDQTHDL